MASTAFDIKTAQKRGKDLPLRSHCERQGVVRQGRGGVVARGKGPGHECQEGMNVRRPCVQGEGSSHSSLCSSCSSLRAALPRYPRGPLAHPLASLRSQFESHILIDLATSLNTAPDSPALPTDGHTSASLGLLFLFVCFYHFLTYYIMYIFIVI